MATAKTDDTKSESKSEPTPPSGQGGRTPKSRPDHQDLFPPNPEPSESAAEKAAEDEKQYEELHG